MAVKNAVVANISSLSFEELSKALLVAQREVAKLRMELRMGQLKNTSTYSLAKKEVARISTAISAKKISEVII